MHKVDVSRMKKNQNESSHGNSNNQGTRPHRTIEHDRHDVSLADPSDQKMFPVSQIRETRNQTLVIADGRKHDGFRYRYPPPEELAISIDYPGLTPFIIYLDRPVAVGHTYTDVIFNDVLTGCGLFEPLHTTGILSQRYKSMRSAVKEARDDGQMRGFHQWNYEADSFSTTAKPDSLPTATVGITSLCKWSLAGRRLRPP